MNEIVAMELIERKSKYATATIYFGIVLLIFLFLELNIGSLIAGLLLAIMLLFFKKTKVYILQISFCNLCPFSIEIEISELCVVKNFI